MKTKDKFVNFSGETKTEERTVRFIGTIGNKQTQSQPKQNKTKNTTLEQQTGRMKQDRT